MLFLFDYDYDYESDHDYDCDCDYYDYVSLYFFKGVTSRFIVHNFTLGAISSPHPKAP